MFKVSLFHGFKEDRRFSMENYSTGLANALKTTCRDRCEVFEKRPMPLRWPRSALLRMRLSRFVKYPLDARSQQSDINHILDHGYGHLLRAIDASRTVVSVHDLIPLLRWKGLIRGVPSSRMPILNSHSFAALPRAAHLLADSNITKDDLVRLLKCRASRITVVPPGIDDSFRPMAPDEQSRAALELGLPLDGRPVVLLIGSDFYKNHGTALRVVKRLIAQRMSIRVAKVGLPDPAFVEAASALGVVNNISFLGIVRKEQLTAAYNAADVLFFPSSYEGFGCRPSRRWPVELRW